MLHAFETDVNNNPYYQTAGIDAPRAPPTTRSAARNDQRQRRGALGLHPQLVLPDDLPPGATFPTATATSPTARRAIGDICIYARPAPARSDWRTILVAGLNSGGRGYYALDVTNPLGAEGAVGVHQQHQRCFPTDATTCRTRLLPRRHRPAVQRLPPRADLRQPDHHQAHSDGKWVVLVTSGYNNTVSGGDGQGYLYILDARPAGS